MKPIAFHKVRLSLLAIAWVVAQSCGDIVKEFNGFTQTELEFLLAGSQGKIWQRTERQENDVIIELDGCTADNYLVFLTAANSLGKPKPLLYGYNPTVCDSLDFCTINPDFCEANKAYCESNPEVCGQTGDGLLYIGAWYAKAPFLANDRADSLIFSINNMTESIQVTNITAMDLDVLYKNRKGTNDSQITETYEIFTPETP